MAGDNQHYIPQFLQRGFSSHKIEDECFTWKCSKDFPPVNQSVRETGADDKFYTLEDDYSVDDAITKRELKLAKLVRQLRDGSIQSMKDPRIPVFLAHIEVRTKVLRETFKEGSSFLIEEILKHMATGTEFVDGVIQRLKNDKNCLREIIERDLVKQGLPNATYKAKLREHLKQAPKLVMSMRPMLLENSRIYAKLLHERLG